jgi:putative membrane protein
MAAHAASDGDPIAETATVLRGMHNMGWGWGILMTIASLAILGLLVGAVLTAVRDEGSPSPREILDRRLAASEIDLDEYGRRRQRLRASGETSIPFRRGYVSAPAAIGLPVVVSGPGTRRLWRAGLRRWRNGPVQ